MTTVYFVGGEDGDFTLTGGSVGSGYAVSTTAGVFRTGFARCALVNQVVGSANAGFIRTPLITLPTVCWLSAQCFGSYSALSRGGGRPHLIRWIDASGIVRVRIRCTANDGVLPYPCIVEKVDAAGTATQVGSAFNMMNNSLLKIDMKLDYSASGGFDLYQAGVLIASASSVDMTTNGVTVLSGVELGTGGPATGGAVAFPIYWSEVILAGSDTRSMGAVTVPLAGNGATQQWTGTYSTINGNTYNDANVVFTSTAAQVEQFTTATAMPTSTMGVIGVYSSVRAMYATGAPTKIDLGLNIGGTDYWSSDILLTTAMAPYQWGWETSPATGVAWTLAGVGSGVVGLSMKSVT